MIRTAVIIAAVISLPNAGLAYCDPSYAPTPTNDHLEREYREELKAEFEAYFSEAPRYLQCLDDERKRTLQDLRDTASRYERFLDGSTTSENQD